MVVNSYFFAFYKNWLKSFLKFWNRCSKSLPLSIYLLNRSFSMIVPPLEKCMYVCVYRKSSWIGIWKSCTIFATPGRLSTTDYLRVAASGVGGWRFESRPPTKFWQWFTANVIQTPHIIINALFPDNVAGTSW